MTRLWAIQLCLGLFSVHSHDKIQCGKNFTSSFREEDCRWDGMMTSVIQTTSPGMSHHTISSYLDILHAGRGRLAQHFHFSWTVLLRDRWSCGQRSTTYRPVPEVAPYNFHLELVSVVEARDLYYRLTRH